MDRSGKVMIDPRFDAEGDFFHGLARVRSDHKWGFIDEKGDLKIPYDFDDALDFIGELAPARIGRKWGYIDLKGRWVVPPAYLSQSRSPRSMVMSRLRRSSRKETLRLGRAALRTSRSKRSCGKHSQSACSPRRLMPSR